MKELFLMARKKFSNFSLAKNYSDYDTLERIAHLAVNFCSKLGEKSFAWEMNFNNF
jgi:hypothetical protein